MSIQERVLQYKVGLISLKELKKFIDFENIGSDTKYYTFNERTQELEY